MAIPTGTNGAGDRGHATAGQTAVARQSRFSWLERYGPLAARILISQMFLISGIQKILDPAGTADQMASRGMFWIPLFLWAAVAVELGGGLSVLLGAKARFGALALFLFLIPVTLTFHNFWTYPPEEQRTQMLFLIHNVALMGGLLLIVSRGAGPFSVDTGKDGHGDPDRRLGPEDRR